MNWLYPESLWAFILVFGIIFSVYFSRAYSKKNLRVLGKNTLEWQVRIFLRNFSMAVFMLLLVLAVADPRRGRQAESAELSGMDVAVCFDVSRSMLTRDISPNRLERGIAALNQIVRALSDARFSLTPFKGDAITRVPMTEDRIILELWIERLAPRLSTVTGTDVEHALKAAWETFPEGVGRNRIIILISDGEALSGNLERIIRQLIIEEIPVFSIVTGTEQGGSVPLADGSYVLDDSGKPVVSRANFKDLERLAEETGGSFHNLSQQGETNKLISIIQNNQKFSELRGIQLRGVYQYRVFLVPALLMLFLYLLFRIWPWKRK